MCRLWLKLGVGDTLLTAANAATAQVGPWPNQNVRIIAPFAAGGHRRCAGPLLADHLVELFGKPSS